MKKLPQQLRTMILDHDVRTVSFEGWAALSNGQLVSAAESRDFDVLLTADQNMNHQQNLAGRRLSIVILPTNRLAALVAGVAKIIQAIEIAEPGCFTRVGLAETYD